MCFLIHLMIRCDRNFKISSQIQGIGQGEETDQKMMMLPLPPPAEEQNGLCCFFFVVWWACFCLFFQYFSLLMRWGCKLANCNVSVLYVMCVCICGRAVGADAFKAFVDSSSLTGLTRHGPVTWSFASAVAGQSRSLCRMKLGHKETNTYVVGNYSLRPKINIISMI